MSRLSMRWLGILTAVVLAGAVACAQQGQPAREGPPANAQLVAYGRSDDALYGYYYVPQGKGPFPAVLWNHGSEKLPGWQSQLAEFYNSQRFVFFVPHRRGQGKSPGPYIADEMRGDPARAVQLQVEANEDVVKALKWLQAQKEVDGNHIVVSGCSFGGIQTLLTAEKGLGARAFIAFAPGAESWGNQLLRYRLQTAAENAKGPVFVLQAENDYNTGPAAILGPTTRAHGGQATIYPAFGSSPQEGHWGFCTTKAGTEVWGKDVLEYIDAAFEKPS